MASKYTRDFNIAGDMENTDLYFYGVSVVAMPFFQTIVTCTWILPVQAYRAENKGESPASNLEHCNVSLVADVCLLQLQLQLRAQKGDHPTSETQFFVGSGKPQYIYCLEVKPNC